MKDSRITRRGFLKGVCVGTGAVLGNSCFVLANTNATESMRKFHLAFTQKVQFETAQKVNLWSPLALPHSFQTPYNLKVSGNHSSYRIDNASNTPILHATWDEGSTKTKQLQISFDIVSRFTQDSFDSATRQVLPSHAQDRYIRTDGRIGEIAGAITQNSYSDIQKAKTIFAWVAENIPQQEARNTYGIRSIKDKSGEVIIRGEDLSATSVFVGMCRAVGLEAYEGFGLKMDGGRYSKAKLDKPEFYTRSVVKIGNTWVPNDILLAIEALGTADSKNSRAISELAFDTWDNNWVLFNFSRDIALKDSQALLSTIQSVYGEIDGTKLSSYNDTHFAGYVIA